MNRIVPLLPPFALLVLVGAAAYDGWSRFHDLRPLAWSVPFLLLCCAYVAIGRRAPAR